MSPSILTIVEGQSEVKSVPVLLRRILHEKLEVFDVQISRPFHLKRGRLVKSGELEKAVKHGVRDRDNVRAVLVIADADTDCPAQLAPKLLSCAQTQTHLPVSVVLAKREFEAWFLGCLEAYRGFRGISTDAAFPGEPEEDDAKGALKRLIRPDNYNTAKDQVRFVQLMDIDLCRERCPSFDKLVRDVEKLATLLSG